MKFLFAGFAATALSVAGIVQAHETRPNDAHKSRDAGTIQSFENLNAAALAKHPDVNLTKTELEQKSGDYVYQVELRDADGNEGDLDAAAGQASNDQQDT